jgi:AcrR family transcriptional regulator
MQGGCDDRDVAVTGSGSIWTRPERSARGPAPEHSRAEIAAAGLALADSAGLGAVTMRSVATAIGTGPASLYRYVANRSELLELMADQARGELSDGGADAAVAGGPAARLRAVAREGRALYVRHPWLLDVASAAIPGPNAVAFIERCLAAMAGADLSGPAKLETIGLFSGAVRLFAQTEIEQRRAGQDAACWQRELAVYLGSIAAAGRHPHLAAALADAAAPTDAAVHADADAGADDGADDGAAIASAAREPDDLFERAMTRILAGLLPPR